MAQGAPRRSSRNLPPRHNRSRKSQSLPDGPLPQPQPPLPQDEPLDRPRARLALGGQLRRQRARLLRPKRQLLPVGGRRLLGRKLP